MLSKDFDKGVPATYRLREVDSEVADAATGFGLGTMYGTNGVEPFDGTSGQTFAGIALKSETLGLDDNQYDQYEDVSVLRKGTVYVEIDSGSSGVTKGDQAAVMSSGNFDAQANLSSGSSGTYAIEIEDAVFKEDGAAGDVVELEIAMPCNTNEVQLA